MMALIVAGCGLSGDDQQGDISGDLTPFAWVATGENPLDTGSGLVISPQVAVEPDPADNDGAGTEDDTNGSTVAVWLEETDADPFDDFPLIIHLYARRAVGANWDTDDSACPLDNRLDNSNNDGICLIDIQSDAYNSSAPKVALDDFGNAVVVWQQTDGTDCFSGVSDVQPCTRIFARTLRAGVWSDPPVLISISGTDRSAANPDIALEPNGDGTAIAVFDQWDGSLWRVRANRCVDDAAGADPGTACGDTSGEWDQAGMGYIGGNSGDDLAFGGRVGMSDNGNAIATFIRVIDATCNSPQTDTTPPNAGNTFGFTCQKDQLYQNRFDFGSTLWLGQSNIDPGASGELCFQNGATAEVCVVISQMDLATSRDGKAVVIAKTHWGEAEDLSASGPWGVHNFWGVTQVASDAFNGNAISVRTFDGSAWSGVTHLYRHVNSDGTFTNCTSFVNQDSTTRRLLNCNLFAPKVGIEPDSGAIAYALYERYNGANQRYDIHAHRYNGSWSGAAVIDVDTREAHAPGVAVDDNGDAVAVWVQKDASQQWRIYSRSNVSNSWVSTDLESGCVAGVLNGANDGRCNLDGNVGDEDFYFNPKLAMDDTGGVLGFFVGWSLDTNTDASTQLYSVTGP